MKPLHFLLSGLMLAGLAACDSDIPPTPTPGTVAPRAYALTPQQVSGYQFLPASGINPTIVADDAGDPLLAAELNQEGFVDGVLEKFQPPQTGPQLPFSAITCQVIIFSSANGAHAYFGTETKRINKPPVQGNVTGTISSFANLSTAKVDEIVALDSVVPANSDQPAQRAFIALIRKGQVVVEVFGQATDTTTQQADFTPYIEDERTLLQTPITG